MARQKSRRDENFPVGSLLIPPHLRADVHAYYDFARRADDIADSPDLDPTEKIIRLDAMEQIIGGAGTPENTIKTDGQVAGALAERFQANGLPITLATDLLVAFRKDAINETYRTWADLVDYCRFSACPVGRFLLALHGEESGHTESDALCTALQLLNHIQDAKDDWLKLKRIYIPTDWLDNVGISTQTLSEENANPVLRGVIGRLIDTTDDVIQRAFPLPKLLRHRSLAGEAMACLTLAQKLSQRLRQQDPIATKVKLSPIDWFIAGTRGLARVIKP